MNLYVLPNLTLKYNCWDRSKKYIYIVERRK